MGVLGLYSYFESKSLGQRRSWTTASSGHPETPSDAEIPSRPQRYFILDGNAYIHHLYCGQFEWIWGGQYSSFVKLLVAHITAIQASGFQLQILFDGPLPLQKLRTRLTRDTEKIHKLTRVMGDLEHYHILGLSNSSRGSFGNGSTSSGVLSTTVEGLDALANNAGGGGGGAGSRSYSHFLIPPLVMEVTLQTLRSLGVDLMVCDGEADGLVAQLALEKSMDPNVEEAYAVSKDSDYFIYNTGSSTKGGYIPLDSLFVAMDPNTSGTTISATVYSQAAISEHLGIRPQFLPLFASLTGNDYLRPDVFEDQIAKALVATTGQKLAGTSNTNHARIKATAAFLKHCGAGSEGATLEKDNKQQEETNDRVLEVMDKVLQDRKELYPHEGEEKQQELRCALLESMDQYSSLTPDLNFSALSTSAETMTGLDRMKEAFRTGQFSFKLMDVVCNKMFWCTPFLEDTDRESAWLVSRELRRWIYGILARNLSSEEAQKQQSEIASSGSSSSSVQTLDFDVVEYVRRGDHLSAETVTAASAEELDEIFTTAQLKAHKKGSRRISYMDVDVAEDLNGDGAIPSGQGEKLNTNLEIPAAQDNLDLASRTSIFLGVLGAETEQVKALPKSFMVLAATLRYLVNALAHSKTRSASVSVANFEVIAFVASVIFLREKYYPETILGSSLVDNSIDSDPSQEQLKQPSIPSTNNSTASNNSSFSLSDEAPPLTKRSLHLSTQYQHALGSVSLLANALHLEDMIPSLAMLFDGLLFQQTLVLARGGTSLETRMQFPESVALYHQILAAVEDDLIDTGEIDVVVVFRSSSKKGTHHARAPAHDHVQLGIFGPDMEPVNQLATPTSSAVGSSTSVTTAPVSGGSLKATKSSGIQKKSSGSSKKRSAGAGSNGGHSGTGGRNGSRSGTGANMFNVLSLGCEF